MNAGRARWAWPLLAASVVLPVAIAVAGNQILNDGAWNLWWGLVAVTLTAAGTLVTHHLTGPAASPAPLGGTNTTTPPGGPNTTAAASGGTHTATAPPGGRHTAAAAPDGAHIAASAADGSTESGKATRTTQTVSGSTAAGDITQIQGAGGVRIVRSRTPAPSSPPPVPSSPPPAPAATDPSPEPVGGGAGPRPGGGHQAVTGSQAGGSIDQISGVQGDVDIES
ncbi:hypothetical protein ACFO60_00505 [Sphaerisporangium dianthi]|uniref:Uncharacterized protein n=2 Tax=Sphaerisporangium dianthi TaxID=1436120 RepID=A0ABV9C804_9ACTN